MKLCSQAHHANTISVVVPTFNEQDTIADTLAHLLASGWNEIIVSDGGSHDDTLGKIFKDQRIKVIHSKRGRGVQINAGVAAASSIIVAVLHADTQFPEGAIQAIHSAMSRSGVVGGCFQLRFDRQSPILNLYARMSRFETVVSTFGDQAYFFWKDAFVAAGGAPDWLLLEDVELRQRLRKIGRFEKLDLSVTTSSRRFDAHGCVVVQVVNTILLLGYIFGIPNRMLAKFQQNFSGWA